MKTSTLLCMVLIGGFLAEASDTPNSNFVYELDDVHVVTQGNGGINARNYFDLSSHEQTIVTLSSNQTFTVHYQKLINNSIDNALLEIFVGSYGSDLGVTRGIYTGQDKHPRPPTFTIRLIDNDVEKGSFTISGSPADTHKFYGPGEVRIIPHSSYVMTYVSTTSQGVTPSYEVSATIDSLVSLNYAVETLTTSRVEQESKFSVSLNSVGDRMAVGSKEGTNTLVRVYEYDGTSWIQLGEDVEQ